MPRGKKKPPQADHELIDRRNVYHRPSGFSSDSHVGIFMNVPHFTQSNGFSSPSIGWACSTREITCYKKEALE
jgi:hypothetical protein